MKDLGWWTEGWGFGFVWRHVARRKKLGNLIGENGLQNALWGDDLRVGDMGLGVGKLTLNSGSDTDPCPQHSFSRVGLCDLGYQG